MKINRELKKARELKGVSLRKFAELGQISPTYLSRIEKGDFVPGEDVCVRLAALLGWNTTLTVVKFGHVPVWIRELFKQYPEEFIALMEKAGRDKLPAIKKMIKGE